MTRLACVVYMQKREVVVRELAATPGRNVLVLFNFLWRNKWIDSVKFVCEYMKFVTTCVVTNRNLQNTDRVLAKNVVGHLEARMWYGRTSQLHASYGVWCVHMLGNVIGKVLSNWSFFFTRVYLVVFRLSRVSPSPIFILSGDPLQTTKLTLPTTEAHTRYCSRIHSNSSAEISLVCL